MKISELILKLEKLKELNGDLDIVTLDENYHYSNTGLVSIDDIAIRKSDFYDYKNQKVICNKNLVIFE